ncbi:MAG TPA: protein-methionine-sulfoxide reductase catalytic subunit MsrP [Rhodopila sp.]|uniref:protein-methionine-sulfoxide reductase catalytic subunit MsrP n=1 Tax=Rhodopila sp. TaxID=2480087 RepID=UPI002CA5B78B|nr:protein-methionine-sulfoxide reductase catalytic subunit MsrP [Rhodopila sp.]HVY16827.1 protein-methionine-sulfoxide reductase catalytic subunit MsrP [Rhodopila sp.]
MHIVRRRGWEIPESRVTPEHVAMGRRAGGDTVTGRRAVLAGSAAAVLAPGLAVPRRARADVVKVPPPGRPLTDEKWATTYNNYYEFNDSKSVWREAQKLPQRPWTVRIEGMVQKPQTIDIDTILKTIPQEERIYRHRCVEAWAMTVPWTGFQLSALLALAEPLGSAKYVGFQTVEDDKVMDGLGAPFYPWPYTEGLTIAEAGHDLTFMVTGMYGKPVPPQNGGPLRVALPWKYGFKSAKAIVKITLTDKQPATFWQQLQSSEYGFWANVNPAVPHPRWSQATERLLGSDERVPTLLFNGYAEQVSPLYASLQNEPLYR